LSAITAEQKTAQNGLQNQGKGEKHAKHTKDNVFKTLFRFTCSLVFVLCLFLFFFEGKLAIIFDRI